MKTNIFASLLTIFAFSFLAAIVQAQTTDFTYQGRLSDNNVAPNGVYTMQFKLYDAQTGGNQIGSPISLSVSVTNGNFLVNLNFGANVFPNGSQRWLEVTVGGVTLSPRQKIASAPYAIRSANSNSADSLSGVCNPCVTSSQISSLDGSKVTGSVATATNAGNVTGIVQIANGGTGSSTKNFVDLSTSQTNIGGNKIFTGVLTGNTINSVNGYNINNNRVLSVAGSENIFVGTLAGIGNTTGSGNALIGDSSGFQNATGRNNSFFGYRTGTLNIAGSNNTVVGANANLSNNLSFATAIGAYSFVTTTDTIVLGKPEGNYDGADRPADMIQVPGVLTVQGGAAIGGGATMKRVLTAAADLDFPSMIGLSSSFRIIVVPGAQVGDAVVLGLPPFSSFEDEFVFTAYVAEPHTVHVRARNMNSSGFRDLPNLYFRVVVLGF